MEIEVSRTPTGLQQHIAAVEEVVASRYSCRGFLSDPVPHEVIERIVSVSQRSASWCNSQAWQLHITEGQGTERFRRALSEHAATAANDPALPRSDFPMPAAYLGVYNERRKSCGLALYQSMGLEKGDRAASGRAMLRNFSFFGAPHLMLVTSPRALGTYGAVDCGSFVSTFLTIARAHNVATIAQGALAVHSDFVRDYFAIPEDRLILCGVSFGYEDPSDPANGFRTERAPISQVVDWITK